MAITTTTQIAAPVNVDLQREVLEAAKARCPYFVGSRPASIAEHAGTFTAKWRRYENLAAATTALTPLTSESYPTRTSVQPSVTDVTATVAKYGNYLALNEEVDLINPSNQDMELAGVLGRNAGQSLNRLQRDEVEDNSTVIYPPSQSSDGTTNKILSLGQIEDAYTTLQTNSADVFTPETTGSRNIGTSPIQDAYWGLTHSHIVPTIRAMTGFISSEKYAGQTKTARGEFGTVGGVRFISSPEGTIDDDVGATGGTNVRETTNSKADLYHTVIFGMNAVGSLGLGSMHIKEVYKAGDRLPGVQMIVKAKGSAGTADPLNEISTAGWKSWHVGKILNGDWIRTCRSAASVLNV